MRAYIYLLAIAILGSACEKTAEIDVPEIDPKIGVYGFMEANQPVTIKIEELTPLFGKNAKEQGPLSGATVILSTADTSFVVPESNIDGTYEHAHIVQGGKAYSIEVSKSGYKTVKASCSIPTFIPGDVRLAYIATPDIYEDSIRRFGFYWDDKPGVQNYYRIDGFVLMNGAQNGDLYFVERNINDQSKDGLELFSGFGQSYFGNSQPINSLEVKFTLQILDPHLHRYMKTYDAAYYSDENPFAEPVIMYSNIEDGVGVFGGLSRGDYLKQVY